MIKKAFDLSEKIENATDLHYSLPIIRVPLIKEFIKILREFKSKNNKTGKFDYLLIPIEKFNKLVGKKFK